MTKEVAVVGSDNQKFAVGYNVRDDKRSRRKNLKMITMKERQQIEKGGKGKV